MSYRLPNEEARTAPGTMGWIILTALKANMDNALCDAASCSMGRDTWKN